MAQQLLQRWWTPLEPIPEGEHDGRWSLRESVRQSMGLSSARVVSAGRGGAPQPSGANGAHQIALNPQYAGADHDPFASDPFSTSSRQQDLPLVTADRPARRRFGAGFYLLAVLLLIGAIGGGVGGAMAGASSGAQPTLLTSSSSNSTASPSSAAPSSPTASPTPSTAAPTPSTAAPMTTAAPTHVPTRPPTFRPTHNPSARPTTTAAPVLTSRPTLRPSFAPSSSPHTTAPTPSQPSYRPSESPVLSPTQSPVCPAGLTSTSSCGVCDYACSLPDATPACIGGHCTVASCNAQFSDCNALPEDGCECNVPNKVGGVATHATASCNGTSCSYSCNIHFADCDGLASNYCECFGICSLGACI